MQFTKEIHKHFPLEIRILRKKGFFKKNGEGYVSLPLGNGKSLNGYFQKDCNKGFIAFVGRGFFSKVYFESTKANFGGYRWWFICPISGQRCNILYLYNGNFASRGALGLYYRNKYRGKLAEDFDKIFAFEDAEKIMKDIKYPYRNGKPTRKFKKVLRIFNKVGYDENYVYESYKLSKIK